MVWEARGSVFAFIRLVYVFVRRPSGMVGEDSLGNSSYGRR